VGCDHSFEDDCLLGAVLDVEYCGIMVIDTSCKIIFVNKSMGELFGQSPDKMIGEEVNDFYLNSNTQPSRLPLILKSRKPEIGDTHLVKGRTVVVNRFPVFKKGKVIGAVGQFFFRDIQEFNQVHRKVNTKIDKKELPGIKYNINNITGMSPQIVDLKETIYKTAPRNSTILIRGESGTGKELFAHAVHVASSRRNKPFVKVNCASIPENLLESELFGYVEGAFTGAIKSGKKGKFEIANGGTIFLDEIGDMGFHMQAKLLRVLQEKEIEPLGSNKTQNVDVRIIAATNVNLEELMKYRKFREDLYYRLNVVTLNIPALRERKEDLEPLVDYFIKQFNHSFSLKVRKVSPEVMDAFLRYSWPGNVRELENTMEQAYNFAEGDIITPQYISPHITACSSKNQAFGEEEEFVMTSEKAVNESLKLQGIPKKETVSEKETLLQALLINNNNKSKAAEMLGISRTYLYKKLKKYSIS